MFVAPRVWITFAGFNGLIAVAAGAYGAHGFDGEPEYLVDAFETGVQYHMWHALALIGVAWLVERTDGALSARFSGLAFLIGILLFSGSLYVFGLTSDIPFQGSAPAGGIALMAGWGLFAAAGLGRRHRSK